MHFWHVAIRAFGGFCSPVKYGLSGAMPEFTSSRLLSFMGMSGKLGSLRCPFPSKKVKNISLSSFNPIGFIMQKAMRRYVETAS
jgi:hypothetical protein